MEGDRRCFAPISDFSSGPSPPTVTVETPRCTSLTECGSCHGQNGEFGIDQEGICCDPGKPHGRELALVLLTIVFSGGTHPRTGRCRRHDLVSRFFQPDLPHEPMLIGDVTGEFVRGFRQFLSPGTGERKTKQECFPFISVLLTSLMTFFPLLS